MLLMAAYYSINSTLKASNKNYDEANYSLLWAIAMIIHFYNL